MEKEALNRNSVKKTGVCKLSEELAFLLILGLNRT